MAALIERAGRGLKASGDDAGLWWLADVRDYDQHRIMAALILFSALALLGQEGAPASNPAPAWTVIVGADMGGASLEGGPVYDELAANWTIDGHHIWGGVNVSALHVSLDIAARGCLPDTEDYRQNITMPRAASTDLEADNLERQARTVIAVLQDKCSLPGDAMRRLLDGLTDAYRDLSARAEKARRPGTR